MNALAAELREKFGARVHVEPMDLARPGVAGLLKQRLDAEQISIDLLINHAGYGLFGAFLEKPLATTLDMLQLNMLSLTELTHVFATDMVARGGGQILLVSSIGAYQATPLYAAYSASKFCSARRCMRNSRRRE
jgi:short-subunit dehydrogenase